MKKPTNPNINFPQAFAIDGQKTDFLEEKIQDGFDPIDPDVFAGDNLNKFIDDTYKGLHYTMDGVNDLYKGVVLYSSTETYNSTSIVFSISEDGIALYHSLTDNNLGNPLTDETKWEELSLGGGGLEILDIGIAPLGINESENKRRYLNGQLIQQSQFTSFTSKLKSRVGWDAETKTATLLPNLVMTEINWQAAKTLSAYGQVGAFVIDDEAGTIRLPAVVNIQGVFDLQNAGLSVPAALPNITGGITDLITGNYIETTGGLFTITRQDAASIQGSAGAGFAINMDYNFLSANPIYSDDAETVQIEAIQYPYFIQVATGVQENLPAINNYEISNPFAFGMSQYYKGELNNLAWLKSNGQWNSGSVYTSFINWVISNVNSGTKDFKGVGYAYKDSSNKMYYISAVTPTAGNTVYADEGGYCFPVGTVALASDSSLTLTIDDDSVTVTRDSASDKAVADTWWITDYDYVYNSTDNTFRLPLLDGTECLPSDKYVEIDITNITEQELTVPANGWITAKLDSNSGTAWANLTNKNNTITTECISDSSTAPKIFVPVKRKDGVSLRTLNINTSAADNYINFAYAKNEGTLYYYVGAVAENADIINAGEFANLWTEKTSPEQAAHAAMPSDRYIDLSLKASDDPDGYIAPADGWFVLHKAGSDGQYLSMTNTSAQIQYMVGIGKNGVLALSIPVAKGQKALIGYNLTGKTNKFRFVYAQGAQ